MSNVYIPLLLHLLYPVPSVVLRQAQNHVVIVTFSERVVNFTEVGITTDGTIADFTGNGFEFCVIFENATYAHVRSGVAVSENNQPNTESNRLTLNA
ncbi:MAG: hypothetical protein OXH00_02695 [Candidatus Poribacteria bacterium]|nr:hypothetical protein [Candidatus Poribacteria bacterium]